jgi:hypothetical protein
LFGPNRALRRQPLTATRGGSAAALGARAIEPPGSSIEAVATIVAAPLRMMIGMEFSFDREP